MRFFAYGILVAVAVSGCGENAAPTIPPDAERDAAVDPDAGVGMDGSVDDGGVDGSVDAGPDGGTPDGGGSWCETSILCPSCPDVEALCDAETPCPEGQVCLSTGCEDLARCFIIGGGACSTDADCFDPAYACNLAVGRCLRIEPGCTDSNDCVAGFACENDACVDRRLPCSDGSPCPHGYTCFFGAPDQRFCRRITRPCTVDLDCLVLGVTCGDPDGDGARECMPSLTPNAPNALSCEAAACDDPAAPVCETTLEGTAAVCGRFGPCSVAAPCALGFDCRDLWGDGRLECVEPGGTCADSSDCAPRTLCGSPRQGGPPACIGAETM